MKTGSERSIEGLKFFPAIAWGVFVMFAAFVYLLTSELKQTTMALEAAAVNNADMMGTVGALPTSVE